MNQGDGLNMPADRLRPVILGLAGGIGSGKTTVARAFESMGWLVVHSDDQAAAALRRPEVKEMLRSWWGDGVVGPDGEVDRSAIGKIVFADAAQRERLEKLIHPLIARSRSELIAAAWSHAVPPAGVVFDAPLLFEAGLDRECDAVAFVRADDSARLARVRASRGWDAAELSKREATQWPLTRKEAASRFLIMNQQDQADLPAQCRRIADILLSERGRNASG